MALAPQANAFTDTEQAILRTVIYADVFDFALTIPELHHFLITTMPMTRKQIEQALDKSERLREYLMRSDDRIALQGHEPLLALRAERERAADALWHAATRYGKWLARLPFVRMVALTGALAMRNAPADDDDLDYVIVTTPQRVWLARAFAVALVKLVKLRGKVICPNYVLSETALMQEPRDLFIAHEIAQMIPLYGAAIYTRMREENDWTVAFLANAQAPYYAEVEYQPAPLWMMVKRAAEFALYGRFGDALEAWEYRRKLRRFAADMQTPNSAAVLDGDHVKGHFVDHGHPALEKYRMRLRELGLE